MNSVKSSRELGWAQVWATRSTISGKNESPGGQEDDSQLQLILRPLVEAVLRCNEEELGKLGIIGQGKWRSQILEKLVDRERKNVINLIVNPDLTINEDSKINENRFTAVEKAVLEEMLRNNGMVNKEKVAEAKWGENSYDSFSDQAINKTMRRLSSKLKKYRVSSLTGVGYKLVRR